MGQLITEKKPSRKVRSTQIQQRRGRRGEDMAAVWLTCSGYEIIERNFRLRYGEIDIIALKRDEIVFVEVKARGTGLYGSAEESVTQQKLARLQEVATIWLDRHPEHNSKTIQFDVIALSLTQDGSVKTLGHIQRVI